MTNIISTTRNWCIKEDKFVPARQRYMETILTQGNGYLSTRGTFEERYPKDCQATLVHGIWDNIPIVFTELANAPDWTSAEIWVNNIRFDMRKGNISEYERTLDLRNGILIRNLLWIPEDDIGKIKLSFERFASLDKENILMSKINISPLSSPIQVRVRASLNAHVENEGVLHWDMESQQASSSQADLVVKTRKTSKVLALSSIIKTNTPTAEFNYSDCPGYPGIEVKAEIGSMDTLVVQKFTGINTSRDTTKPLILAKQVASEAAKNGYETVKKRNNKAWQTFWDMCDVTIEGDDDAQLAVRHALFQLRIAAPTKDEKVSIGAKTLSGFGYRGHVFWDTEIFILPFFTLTQPEIARNLLMYRYHTLPGARRKAAKNGYKGAQFPWESAETGDEVTPTWIPDMKDPMQLIRIWTGDIEIHINADIAYALYQYWQLTGDESFWLNVGIPILLETAIFWADRIEKENGTFSIRNIIGPDEYHEHVDNNSFTNYLAQWHLKTALSTIKWLQAYYPLKAEELITKFNLTTKTLSYWRKVQRNLVILYDPETKLFEQFEGFFDLNDLDLSQFINRTKSIQAILGIERTNDYQLIKQADVIMLLCLFRNEFEKNIWEANWDYYNPRTDHEYGSSLGPAMQAWAACEMNKPDLAYEHFVRAARADLKNIRGNTEEGIHAASAGGLWQAIVFGFAGLNFGQDGLTINPRMPSQWKRLSFKVKYRGSIFQVDIQPDNASLVEIKD